MSGSAALSADDHGRIARTTGQRVIERYGMTETLMNTAVRIGDDRRPGYVGPPVDGSSRPLIASSTPSETPLRLPRSSRV